MAAEKRLIDANALKEKLKSMRQWLGGPPQADQDKLAQSVIKMCIEEVDKLKPVDAVEVVHGRWEWPGPYRYNGDGVIGTCSVCKERLRLFATNYCPNCGAKMDG